MRLVALPIFVLVMIAAPAQAGPVDQVNTLRGSLSTVEYSRGNTFPAVTVPFGFNFWTPVTEGNSQGWLYRYDRDTLQGFGLCHQPSPWVGDHGAIQIMPQVGALAVTPDARKASFKHERELARPHYYSVELESSGIRVEFTPTDRAARFRFTYPGADSAYLLFDSIDSVKGEVRVDAAQRTIEGHVDHHGPRLYFFADVNKEIAGVEYPEGAGAAGAIRFSTEPGEVVELRIATSFLSIAQARTNLAAEIGERSFDEIREAAAKLWNERLSVIEIEGATERQAVTFYSNLYRAFMYPNSMWEQAGERALYFSPYDQREHDGKIWVNNGFWDTYRAAWPLYLLLVPEAGEMLQGFVRAYLDGGWTPRWSGPGYLDIMVGTHPDSVFADAYLKGVRNFDVRAAYESMLKNALVASGDGARGRKGNEQSIFLGYVPLSTAESAAWSLENYVNDYGIAQLAHALGDEMHARYFRSRARSYVELFSREVMFFRGKDAAGKWRTSDEEFEPRAWGHEFTEGNAWQYSLAANHDPQGMALLYGGRPGMTAKLDGLFEAPRDFVQGGYQTVIHEMREAYDTNMGQYAHANEPTHHMIYMYNYAATPWKTQRRVRDVLDEARGLYGPGLGDGKGYLGDEDNGQMSAWFVFSALGFYPASPSHPEYAIGSPLFRRAAVRLPNGKRFVVRATDNSEANVYVQAALLNGQLLARNYLTHDQILAGGELELIMGAEPSLWGSAADAVPSSLTRGDALLAPLRDQTRGATVTASSDRPEHAFDDDSRTAWSAGEAAPWIGVKLDVERAVQLYTLTSSSGEPSADPVTWTLEVSSDGARWQVVDRKSEQTWQWRQHTRVFAIDRPVAGSHYRLRVDANGGAARTELSEIELLWSADHDRDTPEASAQPPAAADGGGGEALKRGTGARSTDPSAAGDVLEYAISAIGFAAAAGLFWVARTLGRERSRRG